MPESFGPTIFNRWLNENLKIEEVVQPKRAAFEIAAGAVVRVPAERHEFRAKYGALLLFSATFDHPKCGFKIEYGLPGENLLDTKETYTVENYMVGSSRYEWGGVYVHVPPETPPGLYLIKRTSDWYWEDWCRMSLINTDTSAHWVLGYGYHLFLAKGGKAK